VTILRNKSASQLFSPNSSLNFISENFRGRRPLSVSKNLYAEVSQDMLNVNY